METIVRRLSVIKREREEALKCAANNEEVARKANERASNAEKQVQYLENKVNNFENEVEIIKTKLTHVDKNVVLKEKAFRKANTKVTNLNERIVSLEKQLKDLEERLFYTLKKIEDKNNLFPNDAQIKGDSPVGALELQLTKAKLVADLSDKKYNTVVKKLLSMEQDLLRAEHKTAQRNEKIKQLENELNKITCGVNYLGVTEVTHASPQTMARKLRDAESRANFAEYAVDKLQAEVVKLEEFFVIEQHNSRTTI